MSNKTLVVGCGRVGLPFLTFLQSKGVPAVGMDIKPINGEWGRVKKAPFKEKGLQELLDKYNVYVESSPILRTTNFENIIITVGTPIDKNHNPDTSQIKSALDSLIHYGILKDGQLLIMRSTLFPGACEWIDDMLFDKYKVKVDLVFAPERIAEGFSLEEIESIPQPVGGINDAALHRGLDFFRPLVKEVIPMSSTRSAEFVKLFSNGYRYVNFALANEFAMRCSEVDVDYGEVLYAVNHNYKRGGLAKASLNVGGYCLAKDWCLLDHKSTVPSLVKKAYEVAEKTPIFYANKYKDRIWAGTVGILGLAFKPGSDNVTDSLSFKMINVCEQMGASNILVYDPYVNHKKYAASLEDVLNKSRIIFVMTAHEQFKDIKNKPEDYMDWNPQIIVRL